MDLGPFLGNYNIMHCLNGVPGKEHTTLQGEGGLGTLAGDDYIAALGMIGNVLRVLIFVFWYNIPAVVCQPCILLQCFVDHHDLNALGI